MSDETLFLLRVNLDPLATKRGPVRRVRVTGGLSRSERLCQRMADGLGCRVERLRGGEGTVTGLWRRLSGSPATSPGEQAFEPEDVSGLEDRYREWLRRMPPMPESADK